VVVQVVLRGPLSSVLGHNKPVRARFWPWLEPFFKVQDFENIQSIPSSLESGSSDPAYPRYSRGNGPRRARPGPGPRRDDGFAGRTANQGPRKARGSLANMTTHRRWVKQQGWSNPQP
jgi:hypothetical protein